MRYPRNHVIHVRVYDIDSVTIEDLDTIRYSCSLARHLFTVLIWYDTVQYRSNAVEPNCDTILFIVKLESIQYLYVLEREQY